MHRLATLLLAGLLALGFAKAQSEPLELAVDQSPVGLDPHISTAFSTFAVIGQIYDALVEVNAQLQMEGALAESWSVSEDGLEYTFELRPDVTFHNGRELTANDVVFSFERIVAEETGSPFASRFTLVEGVEARDERTVVFSLQQPFAPFLSNLLDLTIVPQEVVEEHGNLQQVAVGTGPFMLQEWVPDSYLLLRANPDYYRPSEPGVAALRYNIVPEASTRASGLRTGTYHILPDVDPATAQILEGAPNVEVLSTDDLAASRFGLNVAHAALADARVRRAINLAINRAELIEAVYFGDAVAGTPISPALADWAVPASELGCYDYDPAGAVELLNEAGYPDGLELHTITFGTMRVVSDTAQVLQSQLAEVGIDLQVEIQEFGTFVQNWSNSNFDAFVSQAAGAIDPDTILYRHFHSTGSANVYNYEDERVDALLEEGQVTVDTERRREVYGELQQTLACEGPAVTPALGTLFSAVRAEVEGFQQIPTRNLRYLRNVTLR